MTRGPPVFRVALAFAAGAAFAPAAPAVPTGLPPTALYLTLLTLLWRRPDASQWAAVFLSLVAGILWAGGDILRSESPCLLGLKDGAEVAVEGYVAETMGATGGVIRVLNGLGPECRARVTTWVRGEGQLVPGRYGRLVGRWVGGASGSRGGAGYVSAVRFEELAGPVPPWLALRSRARERARTTLRERFGTRAGVAGALTLADRQGVDPAVKEAFVRSGTAHLLSISGFHVGVVAGILAGAAGLLGRSPRTRAVTVTCGVWVYVALIGLPTSASRAAWMTTALMIGTLRGRPVLRTGALGAAMLVLALVDPAAVSGPGYQLTVAGTAGLMSLGRWVERHLPGEGLWSKVAPGVAAGVGASVVTAPILAFHFGELSLLTIPASLLLTPLVATAIPGVMAVILWDAVSLPGASAAAFLVDSLLVAIEKAAVGLGRLPWATVSVTGVETTVFLAGAWMGVGALRAPWSVPAWARVWLAVCSGAAGLTIARVGQDLSRRGTVEISAIDVGQGDAIAVRTARGRWILVDAGPRSRGWDAGAARVVPFLQSRGVARLEAVIVSHPDEDHAGGLEAVLEEVAVGTVLDPGRTVGQSGQRRALALATRRAIPWRRVVTGDRWVLDGVELTVLHPDTVELGDHPNDWSVVLHLRYGDFDALLTGDAEGAVEDRILEALPRGGVEVLKVGHHGSRTSSSRALLARIQPRVALISAGSRNRYGHPAPSVLHRLRQAGAVILRTDLHGTVGVTGRRDGSWTLHRSRR